LCTGRADAQTLDAGVGENATHGSTSEQGARRSVTSHSNVGAPSVRISQMHGGGGNTGSQMLSDYIELYNAGSSAQDLTSWSVQYNSDTGTACGRSRA